MNILCPEPLQRGDIVGLISPSSPITEKAIEVGVHLLKSNGFNVKYAKHMFASERFLAGKDRDRAQDVMDFFIDSEVKAIIATRGGQGSQRLLPFLDYELIKKNPKPLFGFSDTTALQLGLFKNTGLVSYTGFTLTIHLSTQVKKTLFSSLLGQEYTIRKGIKVHGGVSRGTLLGGNLTLMTNLMGTPYMPTFKGCILLVEDVGVEPYNIDGMFSQLDLAGIFDEVSGVIFGTFEQCKSKKSNQSDGTVEDVINEWASKLKVPCIKEFSYGHGKQNCILPIGKVVTLDADTTCVTIQN
ncbi:TPA: LD-carboxypeptidase [Legionella pneumophila]|uniref:LD-carboxypeptidase n=1 Tax=Legionella bononiensis TaxID=2793102 RepID=A0ABS1WEV0_9GAMM|nr:MULTISPECIES: LD-carboxypeptidase [Legionellaceae]HAT8858050.1 LD-carboxypeptidase [Legionella pneumophila subsp. pneumophila]KTD12341.1 muramoyltetrapeptide carboxypeptidase [Legionella hackeliae]MBL7478677.1 LD-carboxypeptidase [Legionella bononiensis]MBL7527877.1 LD-carboxypeptidase [Legionella bononiensis]MBL7563681.1 LD-carboxypeptidase [Legionella bononiensis]